MPVAELRTSTCAPSRVAPDESVTVPPIPLCVWARAPLMQTNENSTSVGTRSLRKHGNCIINLSPDRYAQGCADDRVLGLASDERMIRWYGFHVLLVSIPLETR